MVALPSTSVARARLRGAFAKIDKKIKEVDWDDMDAEGRVPLGVVP
jgi:hypothetical protein